MYQGHRVVVVIPGGRRRFLRCLMPHLSKQACVDEVRIVLNTSDRDDLEHMRGLQNAGIVVQDLPDGAVPSGNRTVNLIYGEMCEPETLYIKVDDDIVWMDPQAVERLLQGLLNAPRCFLATPVVINNGLGAHVLQRARLLDHEDRYIRPVDAELPRDARLAERLHRCFLGQLEQGMVPVVPDQIVASMRFSINMVAFRGADMAALGGAIADIWRFGPDDEEYLTVHAPAALGKHNLLVGDAVAAHFSFRRQRQALEATDLLARYRGFLPE